MEGQARFELAYASLTGWSYPISYCPMGWKTELESATTAVTVQRTTNCATSTISWSGRIRTCDRRIQSPLPYRLGHTPKKDTKKRLGFVSQAFFVLPYFKHAIRTRL